MKSILRSIVLVAAAIPGLYLLIGLPERELPPAEIAEEAWVPVDPDTWSPEHRGFRMRIPPGWTARSTKQRDFIERNAGVPHDGSFNAVVLPNLRGLDLDGMFEENVGELRKSIGQGLESAQRLRVSYTDVLRFDYRVKPNNADYEVRAVCVLWLAGGNQRILTAQVRAELWDELGPLVEDALSTLSID